MRTKTSSKQIDMLHGALGKKIIIFALPIAASSIMQQLFNVADMAIVGRFAGSQAMAAVGSNGALISMFLNLFIGISVGANVVISYNIGQDKKDNVNKAVHTAIVTALVSGVFLLIAGVLLSRRILLYINTPDNILDMATLYLHLYFMGVPFILIYNFGAAILRSIGDTSRPMYCLILSGVLNVALNLVLVIVFEMSVAGVGIATSVSNLASACMVLWFLVKETSYVKLEFRKLRVAKAELLMMLRTGVPAGLQSMMFSLSNVFIQSAVNRFGSDTIAGSAAAGNFEALAYFVIAAFVQAAITFTSQNYGAGQIDRCRRIFRFSLWTSGVMCGAMCLIFILFRVFFIGFFTEESAVAEIAYMRMVYVLSFEVLICLYEIPSGSLRGFGYSVLPTVITVMGSCVLRIAWVYAVKKLGGSFLDVMIVFPVSWILMSIPMMFAYVVVVKKLKHRFGCGNVCNG